MSISLSELFNILERGAFKREVIRFRNSSFDERAFSAYFLSLKERTYRITMMMKRATERVRVINSWIYEVL